MHRNASLSRPERDKETLCVSRGPLTKPQGLLFTPPPVILNERREARAQKKQLFSLTNYSSEPRSVGFELVSELGSFVPSVTWCCWMFGCVLVVNRAEEVCVCMRQERCRCLLRCHPTHLW